MHLSKKDHALWHKGSSQLRYTIIPYSVTGINQTILIITVPGFFFAILNTLLPPASSVMVSLNSLIYNSNVAGLCQSHYLFYCTNVLRHHRDSHFLMSNIISRYLWLSCKNSQYNQNGKTRFRFNDLNSNTFVKCGCCSVIPSFYYIETTTKIVELV